VVPAIYCPAQAVGLVNLPETRANQMAQIACPTGYSGTITALCNEFGTWKDASGVCVQLKCAAQQNVSFANWSDTPANTTVNGTCIDNYIPANGIPPLRTCRINGEWNEVMGSCIYGTARNWAVI